MGSSPRVWGQGFRKVSCIYWWRIIPTRMGTRHDSQHNADKAWDHPHAYGDKIRLIINTLTGIGSSPRVWGQVSGGPAAPSSEGIIPTRMGTRMFPSRHRHINRDHPHAYGDKVPLKDKNSAEGGSSPRVWGQVGTFKNNAPIGGIIPTRMGTSV